MPNPVYFDNHKGAFSLTGVGHFDHPTANNVVTMHFVNNGQGVWQIDVLQAKLDVVIS